MKNTYIGKKKFLNFITGKNKNHFFLFPAIIFTHEEKISWDLVKGSITFTIFNIYLQVNIFTIVKDSGKEIFKQDVANIIRLLKESNFIIKDMNLLIKFLQENIYLITIIKNINLEHPYAKKIIVQHFKNCDFVAEE